MSEEIKRPRKRRVSYLSTFVSITLVLFLVGLFGVLVVNINQIQKYLKENLEVSLYFHEDTRDADIQMIRSQLEDHEAVRNISFVSKEEARIIMQEEMGEEAIDVIGYNPFPSSLKVNFNEAYAVPDSISSFVSEYEESNFVKEVFYQKAFIGNLEKNIRLAGTLILILAIIFLVVVIGLINSTLRLTMFSNRFLIKTMQLIGATGWFIRKPFVFRSVWIGVLGATTAVLLLIVIIWQFSEQLQVYAEYQNYINYLAIFAALYAFAIIITFVASLFAVNKYLRLKIDDLY